MKESLLRIMMLTSLTMVQTISLLARLIDTLAPRSCTICGRRLTVTEEVMCACCNHCLPRTGYAKSSYDNRLVRLFWGRIPIEKGTAFFFYKAHSEHQSFALSIEVWRSS